VVATLREIYAKSRHPSHEDKESAAHVLASIIEQAQAIGRAHASSEQERGMAWGGDFLNALQSGWDIVTNFVSRITDWIQDQISGGNNPSDDAIQAEIDTVASNAGSYEVQSAIEQEVWQTLYMAGVTMVESVPQPGACEACLARASAGPVPINDYIPPPFHNLCKCGTRPANKGE
jgi:hypothetical protein